jgi:hypothetical protein
VSPALAVDGFARRELGAAVEIVCVGAHVTPLPDWLRISVDRWLWLDPVGEILAELTSPGLIVVDVDGKWVVYDAEAVVAHRVLTSAVDVDEVLASRGHAAVTLFDCPAVVARGDAGRWLVCVHASYAASFEHACAASLAARTALDAAAARGADF